MTGAFDPGALEAQALQSRDDDGDDIAGPEA